MTLTDQTLLQANADIIDSEIDDELVMMNIDTGDYFGLNAIGTRIWQLIKEPTSLKALRESLTEEFDVDERQCMQDIEPLLTSLHEAKLISIS